ncbi:hypothetical protein PAI11_04210 [Patulibacter medicamentivorans]|jgi:hypothetical protein|uniref:DUF4267 domain-containing protein n=1 Tax=Patulibacter medicamentivorans TaxID=1097667 RepID=H0E0W3_9ACTN|nr:hypothetical protein [Patulibacter medicamentivorans]EHN12727.1 hypothetical protein PAI11_04210 [Patulibacter medicamentivorans]
MAPIKILQGIRLAVGVGAWAAPNLTGKLFGLDPEANPQAAYPTRLFGVRDAVLGVGTLATRDPAARRLWLQLGIVTDAVDVASAALGGREGSLPKQAAALAGGVAVAAVGLGVAALLAEREA